MSDIYISRGKFPEIIGQLMARYRVYAPVLKGEYHEFAEIEKT